MQEFPFQTLSRNIGDGHETRFWLDGWLAHSSPLKDLFPKIYALEVQKDCLIADCWVLANDSWEGNWNWRHSPRGRALDELSYLLQALQNLKLASDRRDSWSWDLEDDGCFNVQKLAAIIHSKSLPGSYLTSSSFWSSWLPAKVSICVWRAIHNALPSRLNLISRGIRIPVLHSCCPCCSSHAEDLSHLFFSCLKVLPI